MPTQSNVTEIEVFVDETGFYRWRAKARNGEIVATGESHTREVDARRAANSVFPGVRVYVLPEEPSAA